MQGKEKKKMKAEKRIAGTEYYIKPTDNVYTNRLRLLIHVKILQHNVAK